MTVQTATAQAAEPIVGQILAEEEHLRRVAHRLTRCDADADDLVQDTLFRAYRARDRFQPGTSIRAWTTTILRRVFLTGAIRTRRRGLETDTDAGEPLAQTSGRAPETTRDHPASIDRIAEQLEDPVKRALLRVPEIYQLPFYLSVIEDLTCSEIAERLGVPEGTVMSRIHRARERLKRDLVYDGLPVRRETIARRVAVARRAVPRAAEVRLARRNRRRALATTAA